MDKRAVIYCRVSTTSDSQTESLEKQILEAKEAVRGLNFELVDCFIDEGRSGTTKEVRREYLRMLSEIELGKFDVIVTKSLDRMNRNILDFYLFLDLILRNHVKLYFYLDRVYYKTDDKLIIGIKAILAEEYSRELSKKLCSAHAKRQELGEVVMLGSRTYGYKKKLQSNGKRSVEIVEEEAKMIRLIFDYCLEGYGARAIGKILDERGYRNRSGNALTESTIRRIIRNPLVTGTMVMNRVKRDFNAKKVIYTAPEEWIWNKGAVPPIISEEKWKLANHMMDLRSQKISKNGQVEKQGRNNGKSELSGKIICGLCGKPYYRIKEKNKRPAVWKCSTYMKLGTGGKKGTNGCCCPPVEEPVLMRLLAEQEESGAPIQKKNSDFAIQSLAILDQIMGSGDTENKREVSQKKLETAVRRQEALLEKYLDGKITDDLYRCSNARLKDEREKLEREQNRMSLGSPQEDSGFQSRGEVKAFLLNEGISQARALAFLKAVKQLVVDPGIITIVFEEACELLNKDASMKQESTRKMKLPSDEGEMKNRQGAIEQSKERIVDMIKENPSVTHGDIARDLKIGERTAYSRTKALRKEGKIGRTGYGVASSWYIVK